MAARKPPKEHTPLTPAHEEAVLGLMAKGHTLSYATTVVGVNWSTWQGHRRKFPALSAREQAAREQGVEALEEEARRRGADGYAEPVVYQGALSYVTDPTTGELVLSDKGQPVPLTIRKYSDNLLMFVTKSRDRERYADRTELTGANGAPLLTAPPPKHSEVGEIIAREIGDVRNSITVERITERVVIGPPEIGSGVGRGKKGNGA